ncbi:specifically androgen-regulated gene protein [Megalops cyprinoides]|uniref:specifically androgen-regulated gene protein n=1 Tax=Megalops cyprinoides TaxID=118141 RepID=UPI0018640963|nr:specifically androgen-regulated gene protein [Megalops cyprinoides]
MPKSDTWPGGIAMETMTSMDSAGSCDSVVSANSGFSDDSLEHLSAEERACLMFLEETIESLEAEEDSGLSNDEPDHLPAPGSLAAKVANLSSSVIHNKLDDVSRNPYDDPVSDADKDHKPLHSYLVPTPLVLANSGCAVLPKPKPEADPSPALSTCLTDLPPDRVDLVFPPSNTSPNSKPSKGHQRVPSEVNVVVIPPPSDFRDDPVEVEDRQGDRMTVSKGPLTSDELAQMRKRASLKKAPQASPEMKHTVKPLPIDLSRNGSAPPSPSEAQPAPLHESSEPKMSPPAVAPKPKRLPSNIILKTHKAPVHGTDAGASQACTSPGERVMMDPQKVRMEALRKLGLLKEDEADSGPPAHSPLHSPKTRMSWGASPAPVSPISTDPPRGETAKAPPSPSPPPSLKEAQDPRISRGHRERSQSDLPTASRPSVTNPPGVKSATLERSGMGLSGSSASPPSSDQDKIPPGTAMERSPSQLRHTRPRPASLGNGKDFSVIQGDAPQPAAAAPKAPEAGDGSRSLPSFVAPPHSSSHKLPRSQGISVLITPRSKTGEDRREALRKLGLLKD